MITSIFPGGLVFSEIWFSYPDGEQSILKESVVRIGLNESGAEGISGNEPELNISKLGLVISEPLFIPT